MMAHKYDQMLTPVYCLFSISDCNKSIPNRTLSKNGPKGFSKKNLIISNGAGLRKDVSQC